MSEFGGTFTETENGFCSRKLRSHMAQTPRVGTGALLALSWSPFLGTELRLGTGRAAAREPGPTSTSPARAAALGRVKSPNPLALLLARPAAEMRRPDAADAGVEAPEPARVRLLRAGVPERPVPLGTCVPSGVGAGGGARRARRGLLWWHEALCDWHGTAAEPRCGASPVAGGDMSAFYPGLSRVLPTPVARTGGASRRAVIA